MTDWHQKQDFGVFQILEKKLEEIADSVGYNAHPDDSSEYQIFLKAWRDYLRDLGILVHSRPDQRFFEENKKNYLIQDPLYTTEDWLVLSIDVLNKILAIGLP